MKKTLVLVSLIGLSALLFFSGCQKDDEPTGPPTINLVAGQGFISDDAIVPVNSEYKVKVAAFMNNETEAKLTALKVSRTFTPAARADWDTTFVFEKKEESVDPTLTFTAANIPGEELLEIQIIDEDSRSDEVSLTVTTESDINSFEMKILGSYNNTSLGSSFASIDGNVYSQQEAFNNQGIIDFLYWWGSTTNATIGAPDDANANLVYTNPTFGLPEWSVKNATRFNTTTLTSADFDGINIASDITDLVNNPADTRIGQLAVGSVIGFETVTGKKGLIRVSDIVVGAAGEITIDVKVEM